MNWSRVFSLGQIMKMSSMYLASSSGLVGWVCRKFLSVTERKMFAMVGKILHPWQFHESVERLSQQIQNNCN